MITKISTNISLRIIRLLADEENIIHDVGEYCYHLASVLLETQKLLAGQEFSANYIEEHCNTLMRYAKIINKEQSSFP